MLSNFQEHHFPVLPTVESRSQRLKNYVCFLVKEIEFCKIHMSKNIFDWVRYRKKKRYSPYLYILGKSNQQMSKTRVIYILLYSQMLLILLDVLRYYNLCSYKNNVYLFLHLYQLQITLHYIINDQLHHTIHHQLLITSHNTSSITNHLVCSWQMDACPDESDQVQWK